MAEITRLHSLIQGVMRGVNLASNTLVVQDLKVGGISGTVLSKAILDKLIELQGSDPTKRAALYSELEAEVTLRTGADNTLQGHIDTEKSDREAADLALQGSINTVATNLGTEVTNRTNADTALDGRLTTVEGKVTALNTLSGVGANAEDLGSFSGSVIADGRTVKQAMQDLETYSENTRELSQRLEWQNSALSIVTAPPVGPASGDRYLIGGSATGAFAGKDNNIAEYNGSAWVFTVPTVGTFIGVDDEPEGLYVYEGSAWAKKFFEATTASQGLTKVGFDVRLANADQGGVKVASGAISVNVDDVTIEKDVAAGNPLQVKDGGITELKLADAAVTEAKIADASITNGKISPDAVEGSKILLGNNQALRSRNAADTADIDLIKVNASDRIEFPSLPQASGTPSVATDLVNKAYVDQSSTAGSAKVKRAVVAGETFAANTTFVVRLAQSGETAGRVYKADNDTGIGDKFHAMGLIQVGASPLAAGSSVEMVMLGSIDLAAADVDFVAADIGKPIHVGTSGALEVTPPSTEGRAVVIVGYVETTTKIDVRPLQIMGVL